MSRSLLIDALGAIVRIDLDGMTDADAAAVRDVWRDALAASAHAEPTPVTETVAAPTVVAAASLDPQGMLADLSQRVTLAALEARRGELWMLHAAGVASGDGRVVVLVGPSGRGKTTAARTLGSTFGYVSDESVAIDDAGRVWPYRKPLSVIEERGRPKAQRTPSELGLRPLPETALRLAAIVLLDRHDDAPERAMVEDVDLGDALEDLVAQSSYLTAMPAPLHTIAALAEVGGGIRRVTYRDASSLRPVVERLLGPADRHAAAAPAGRVVAASAPDPNDTSAAVYSRTPVVDSLDLADPDRLALLRAADDGTGLLHVLGGIAPAIWRAAGAASLSDLTSAVVAVHGPPDRDPRVLVGGAVDELVAAGVLREQDNPFR